MTQNRFKSKATWLLVLPLIVLLGDAYGLWNIINMNSTVFTKVFISALAVLEGFGLFNNPQNKTGF